ncbi:MAG: glutamine synthetase III, partial [Eggerthellaceae bacterium]|nr:glutamine synthetase III [Eggerthellaceae bacterium]
MEQYLEDGLAAPQAADPRFEPFDISKIYGTIVFDDRDMREYLAPAAYEALRHTIDEGLPLDKALAADVADGMKRWALAHGATHYTHWFQPLSGTTSEKHDAFMDPQPDGSAIAKFGANALIQGESDASSFPNGGLRATFEARGYTAWDPTSYAFITDEVLCIPTAFASYTGEALDKKTPLLRSMGAISRETKRVLALFGEEPKRVTVNVGAEQEFFLIPKEDYARREDLVMCGRTLFGSAPCKGQELEEHYYGSIRPTVNNFLKELDDELWALGIAAKTKHNEVAPAQHELAPIFTTCNRAVDENLLTMEKMTLLASHYGLACLFHEKPFEGINGSGKHNNWSVGADGENLLDPGTNPRDNLRFLVFMSCIIAAVDDYQDLLRLSVASAGNDHRLGANEAPPAIVSIFLGEDLTRLVDALVDNTEYTTAEKVAMNLGAAVLPDILKDNTDRNRTSPFAFTGNKFEFRMPGSNANLSDANTVLNTAVASALADFADALESVPAAEFEAAA